MVKQWEIVPKSNAFETSSVLCRLHFDLEGRNVAIPVGETVKLYRRETWVHAMTLSSTGNNVSTYKSHLSYIKSLSNVH